MFLLYQTTFYGVVHRVAHDGIVYANEITEERPFLNRKAKHVIRLWSFELHDISLTSGKEEFGVGYLVTWVMGKNPTNHTYMVNPQCKL